MEVSRFSIILSHGLNKKQAIRLLLCKWFAGILADNRRSPSSFSWHVDILYERRAAEIIAIILFVGVAQATLWRFLHGVSVLFRFIYDVTDHQYVVLKLEVSQSSYSIIPMLTRGIEISASTVCSSFENLADR